jgi:nifR3 family TIM-barrel protein
MIFPGPVNYGSLRLRSRYLLSPLAGFTNMPFRRVVHEIGGVGLTTTDLVNARALLEQRPKTLELIATSPVESPFAVQIFGSDAATMCAAAQLLEARGVDSIDINMGCPVRRIVADGSGASMMCRPEETFRLVRSIVEAVRVPVTVKMRLGWDATQITAPFFAREFEQIGVAAIAIHGRTRAQGFSGSVDRRGIRQVVEAVQRIPVIGNGDVRTVADAEVMLRETGCHGVSIGRGALANPWIFRQLVEWETTGSFGPSGTFDDRLELMQRQFRYLCERCGVAAAISGFRKMAHWYLKAMHVPARLRHEFQLIRHPDELHQYFQKLAEAGPIRGDRTGELPEMHIPVPSGPVERW